jgi:cation diffusion facilitator family transporter
VADGGKSESLITVVVAFVANAAIAIAQTVAAMLTGSASMVAESAHSWADTGNEVFLFVAERRAGKEPDAGHPLGYGRDAYVWSMFAAVGLFTVGAVLSIQHGISELASGGESTDPLIAYIVLAVSFVLETVSFLRALGQVRRSAGEADRDVLDYALNTSDPTVRAVFFEDLAALAGILIAALGIVLHEITGSEAWDAAGSIGVGVLLGIVAVVLIQQNRKFLIGEAVNPDLRRGALQLLLEHPEITRVTYLHLEYVGPGQVFLVAAVDLEGNSPEDELAERLRRLNEELQAKPHILRAVLTLSTQREAAVTP